MTVLPEAPDSPEVLGEMLDLILDKIVGTFEHWGVALPARQYLSYGAVAVDCEQLTVQLGQVYPGQPGSDPNVVQNCAGPRTAVTIVQLFRKSCVTTSGPRGQGVPTPESLTANARMTARDAWLMLEAARGVDAAGWGSGVIMEVSPVDEQGGYVGVAMTLTLLVP